MADEINEETEIYTAADGTPATIWGQKSDIDWLAPATTAEEYAQMVEEDRGLCDGLNCECGDFCDETTLQEEIDNITEEDIDD